jgi:hypothetical protein
LLHGYDKECASFSKRQVEQSLRRLRLNENCNHRRKKIITYRVGGFFNGDVPVQFNSVLADVQIKKYEDMTFGP